MCEKDVAGRMLRGLRQLLLGRRGQPSLLTKCVRRDAEAPAKGAAERLMAGEPAIQRNVENAVIEQDEPQSRPFQALYCLGVSAIMSANRRAKYGDEQPATAASASNERSPSRLAWMYVKDRVSAAGSMSVVSHDQQIRT